MALFIQATIYWVAAAGTCTLKTYRSVDECHSLNMLKFKQLYSNVDQSCSGPYFDCCLQSKLVSRSKQQIQPSAGSIIHAADNTRCSYEIEWQIQSVAASTNQLASLALPTSCIKLLDGAGSMLREVSCYLQQLFTLYVFARKSLQSKFHHKL